MNTTRLLALALIAAVSACPRAALAQALTMSVAASTEVPATGTINVPVSLSDGANVSAGQFTLTLSPTSGLEIVGVAAGSLLQPAASFAITTNPEGISTAAPTSGPLTVLIDSTGANMASGSGSLVNVAVRRKSGCSGQTSFTLSNARVTRSFVSVTPTVSNGVGTCSPPPGTELTLAAPSGILVDGTTPVPLQLNDGTNVSGGGVTVSLAPQTCLEIVGVALGSSASPAASFTLTTNPQVISPASPASGPVVILVDSTGANMAAGPGSFVVVSLRCKADATCGPQDITSIVLSAASLTRNLQSIVPGLTNGSAACDEGPTSHAVIALGDVTARADSPVDVPLTLQPSADCDASSLSADISFNPSLLAPPSPCVVSVGPAAAGWSAQCNLVASDLLRVVLFGSTGALAQGTVATVRFDIASGLTWGTEASLGMADCAASSSQPVEECPTECEGAVVDIGGLPGDWNNDGEVLITELQMAVNCLLGRSVPDGCGPADTNGNGIVSVVELQCVVNNFLDVVPACTGLN